MEEAGRSPRYYLNDELGSPLRVLYGTGKGDVYGYDEFGNDISEVMEKSEFEISYSRQGEGQPFGYTGYRYDEISGTYFAQAREYNAGIGRFMAEDVIRGNGAVSKTLNRYGYCWGNPIEWKDLDGLNPISTIINSVTDDYDEQGKEILDRYIYGDGSTYIIENDIDWSNYMMANEYLTKYTGEYLAPIGQILEEGQTKEVNIEISMIIQDNNNKTGYMLLYGSNKDVGDYQIKGTVAKDMDGTITYDMQYTFNDIMDVEFRYLSDTVNYNGLKVLKGLDDSITMNDYNFHVSWVDKTIIYADGRTNEGWLANMIAVDFETKFAYIDEALNIIDSFWWRKKDKKSMLLTQDIYIKMQNYMESHPEYYGCFVD